MGRSIGLGASSSSSPFLPSSSREVVVEEREEGQDNQSPRSDDGILLLPFARASQSEQDQSSRSTAPLPQLLNPSLPPS